MNQKTTTWIFFSIALVYIIVKWIDIQWLEVVVKPLPVFLFAFLAWSSSKYNRLLSIGFVLSGFGDIFLTTYIGKFIPGLVSFLLAHVFYVVAFVQRSKKTMWLAALLPYSFGVVIMTLFHDKLGELLIPVIVYIFVILTMVWRSFAQQSVTENAKWATYGAVFFAISDSVLAYNKFIAPVAMSSLIVMSTYWIAQYLIFLSADKKE